MRYEATPYYNAIKFVFDAVAVLLSFAVAFVGWTVYARHIDPAHQTYSSSLSVIINSEYDTPAGATGIIGLSKTAASVISGTAFIDENIIKKGGVDLGISEISSMVDVSITDGMLSIDIHITADTPQLVEQIADAYYEADYSLVSEKVKGCRVVVSSEPTPATKNTVDENDHGGLRAGVLAALIVAAVIVIYRVTYVASYINGRK